jgi:hypothetical protein
MPSFEYALVWLGSNISSSTAAVQQLLLCHYALEFLKALSVFG